MDQQLIFTKKDVVALFDGNLQTRNSRLQRARQHGKLLPLKKGLFIDATTYLQQPDKFKLTEYIASQMCQPSYISLEYVLEKYHLLFPRSEPSPITSITTKTTRSFTNFAGSFTYSNVKPSIYFGFEEVDFQGQKYHIATKAKALFDYFYMDSTLDYRNEKHLKHQLFEELDIQWANFSEEDFAQFDGYVWKSNSFKMMKIRRMIETRFEGKKFDRFAKELLG